MKKGNHTYYQSNSPPPPYYGYPNQQPQPAASSYSYVSTPMMVPMPVYYGHPQQVPQQQYASAPQYTPAPQYAPAPQQVPAPQQAPAPQPTPTPQQLPTQQQAPTLQQIPIQPTYVTNYIYQQPQPPVVEDIVDWAPATEMNAAEFKHRALVATRNAPEGPTWIIRAQHCGNLIPGKWVTGKSAAFIPHGGREIPVSSFEILLAEENAICWTPSSGGEIPSGAIVAGSTSDGEALYIGRAKHNFYMINGKVQPSKKSCYITYRGAEIPYRSYDVLCQK